MKQTLQNSSFAVAMLASSSVWAKSNSSDVDVKEPIGKSALGVNQLALDITPTRNTSTCVNTESVQTKSSNHMTPTNIVLSADPAVSPLEVTLTVSDILPSNQNKILVLAYSLGLNSANLLDKHLEILALYNVPAQNRLEEERTSLGTVAPIFRSKVSFSINLDAYAVAQPCFDTEPRAIYLQAALLPEADYNKGNLSNMTVSEVNTITFVPFECPENTVQKMTADEYGNLQLEMIKDGQTITKSNN